MSAVSAGSVRPSIVTRTTVQTPLISSIVALSSMTGMGVPAASGFSRLSVMIAPSSESESTPSLSVKTIVPAASAPSCIAHWR